ncbi:MAG: glycosyltransferase family 4 protein [bacterium]
MQYNRVLKKVFDVYYVFPERDGTYHLLSESEQARTTIIPRNNSVKKKFRRFFALFRLIKQNKIDIVMHVFLFDSVLMIILKLLTGVKIVLYFGAARLGWKHRIYSHLYDRIILKNHAILDATLKKMRKIESIPLKKSALTIFDSSLFFVQKAANGRQFPDDSNKLVLGFLGRIDNQVKGLFELMDALSYLNSQTNYTLRIMGDVTSRKPNDKKDLINKAESAGVLDKIEFIRPSVSPEEKKAFFKSIDIFCLPSIGEGSPIVVFEAISFLVPVVATKVGSLPFYFSDRKEIMFTRIQDPEDLANKIDQLGRDRVLYETIVKNMCAFIDKIESSQLDQQLIDIFKSIL